MAATPRTLEGGAGGVPNPFGKVYSPKQLGELWQLSEQSVRRIFESEPGVFVLGSTGRRKRSYQTLRIPEEVALRVWRARLRGVTR
jgi:hypothetical protein